MNWFKQLRRYIIIKTAENYYDKMALQCNSLYQKTRKHHYLIIDPWTGKRVTITNRDNFRATKRAINDSGMRMAVHAPSEAVFTTATMPDVHSGCYYSSLLQKQLDDLRKDPDGNAKAIRETEKDIATRRKAYIKWTLDNAKIRKPLFSRIAEYLKIRRGQRIVKKQLQAHKKGVKK